METNEVFFDELTNREKEQARASLLSLYEDLAYDGGDSDYEYYEALLHSIDEQDDRLRECVLYKDSDGYIEISF